jgi:hypothetical protein
VLHLAFQFDILDIEGKDNGVDLLVCAVCVFGDFWSRAGLRGTDRKSKGGGRDWTQHSLQWHACGSPALVVQRMGKADSSPKELVRNDKGWDEAYASDSFRDWTTGLGLVIGARTNVSRAGVASKIE